MEIPRVVIVGRPNVGKSSLFNWLAGRRIAIVDPTAGVTRDRVTHLLEVQDRYTELIDTGGMGGVDADNLADHIEEQISIAVDSADVLLFVVDTRSGPAPLDEEVAKRLRYLTVPVVCVANKSDSWEWDPEADTFYRFGYKVLAVSAEQKRGKEALLQAIYESLPAESKVDEQYEEPTMKVAIVGRRNTGKSTFVNTLAEAERMIVSEVPGTTRDSVDVCFELDGKAFMAIDTPGFKRGKSISTDLDFYSMHRAQRSIRRADVVLLFFDPTQRISK
ncbi:MAG: ribosome biogenesis GTPase Der, partial [Planctomycetes bacterium]|nr:ribosome biogenesis GTPase Der [Planctomycetota bacterium]